MTQGDKEKMAGRRREMQGKRDERDDLEKGYSKLGTFSNPMSKFPLTYHSELMDEDPALFGVGE